MLVISVLFTYDLPFERALASPLSTALNANESNTNATTSGSTNTTSATGAISENLSGTLGNATIALENATALATNATAAAANATRFAEQAGANATRVLTNVSRTAADVQLLLEEIKTNATRFNTTEQLEAFSSTISTSVGAITFLIVIPIIANMLLRYWQGRKLSEKGTNILPPSINQLYRVLVAIGVIFVVILIVAYLNSLIWFSTAQDQMDVVTNLLETQKNFLTIIGTAFASLVAFYFGTRGSQNSNTTRTTTTSTGNETAPQQALKVDEMNPLDRSEGIEVDTPVTATFNNSIRSSTINDTTFSVKDDKGKTWNGKRTFTENNKTFSFNPIPSFEKNTTYTVTFKKGIMDKSGASLAADVEWHFKTVVA